MIHCDPSKGWFLGRPRFVAGGVALAMMLLTHAAWVSGQELSQQRAAMLAAIQNDVRQTSRQIGLQSLTSRVLEAMGRVPRHVFVPAGVRDQAYQNRPLPIGYGQTISQPYIVAIMTELLQPEPDDTVFELGTGSGYQAAVLAELVDRVFSVEIVPELGQRARQTLSQAGYDNVTVRVGDGYYGWPEQGPFDAIVVTAAGDHIPPPLVAQLKPGGRMVLPVGSAFMTQQLVLVEKHADGTVTTRALLPVRFVPLRGGH